MMIIVQKIIIYIDMKEMFVMNNVQIKYGITLKEQKNVYQEIIVRKISNMQLYMV